MLRDLVFFSPDRVNVRGMAAVTQLYLAVVLEVNYQHRHESPILELRHEDFLLNLPGSLEKLGKLPPHGVFIWGDL
jgi:hypothetical protein